MTELADDPYPDRSLAAVTDQPFRPFFVLAACDAILGAVLAMPGASVGASHQTLLLFGTIPAMLAGFLLTALPRWTGCRPVSSATTTGFVVLWLAMRVSIFTVGASAASWLSSSFIFALACVLARHVIGSRNSRNYIIVTLLFAFAIMPIVSLAIGHIAMRLVVGIVVCLMIIIAGRVTPALSDAALGEEGRRVAIGPERATAAVTVLALSLWVLAPENVWTGWVCLITVIGHLARLFSWRGWRTISSPSVFFLHLAYLWIPAGFGFLTWHVFDPSTVAVSVAIHAWVAGAFGSLSIAIMGSMTRKRTGRAFDVPAHEYCAYALITIAAVVRLLAGVDMFDSTDALSTAAITWAAAFLTFLAANRNSLLPFNRSGT